MKALHFLLICFFAVFILVPGQAQDTFREIERYNPETDPQVNFPQQMIDEATGQNSGDETGQNNIAPGTAQEGQPTVTPAAEGTPQAALVRSAAEHYRRYAEPGSFPYLPETGNGNKGCAQVVNSIFEGAGMPIFGPNIRSGSEDYYNRIRVVATVNKLKEMN
ncbi:MAG: hypothetical protein ACOYXC_00865, partial [Candidatus Rifleibacteriota bacterium]